MLLMTAALLLMFHLSGCRQRVEPGSLPPSNVEQPTESEVQAACGAACVHQRKLGCELGGTTPAGSTCEEVCEMNAGSGFSWATACLAAAPTCTEECRE
jgi:hypothetical protein